MTWCRKCGHEYQGAACFHCYLPYSTPAIEAAYDLLGSEELVVQASDLAQTRNVSLDMAATMVKIFGRRDGAYELDSLAAWCKKIQAKYHVTPDSKMRQEHK